MSHINDPIHTPSGPPPAPETTSQPVGFCQNCGKPLTTESIRRVGPAVYCEPCLAARIGGNPPPGYRPVNPGTGPVYGSDAWMVQGLSQPGPNPGLAALLGFIPGVGAMYNEQYAKGIVHLVVFTVLVSLANNVNGVFGLFVAGWEFYMAIEAHHTARARRDGTPLPNPFGLNDISERFGFGRAWPHGPSVAEVAHDAAAAAAAAAATGFNPRPGQPPYQAAPNPTATKTGGWGAPVETDPPAGTPPPVNDDAHTQAAYAQQFTQAATQAAYNQAYRDMGFGSAIPPVGPYTVPPGTPIDPATFVSTPSRFPAGAVVLIGLGVIFLLTTTGIFSGFPAEALVGCVMLGIGAWLFLRRMMENGASGFSPDGTAGYTLRLLSALRVSVWVAALGILFLLDAFNLFTWHKGSWSLLIILAGVMALAQRASSQALANSYQHPHPIAPAPSTSKDSKRTDSNQGGA